MDRYLETRFLFFIYVFVRKIISRMCVCVFFFGFFYFFFVYDAHAKHNSTPPQSPNKWTRTRYFCAKDEFSYPNNKKKKKQIPNLKTFSPLNFSTLIQTNTYLLFYVLVFVCWCVCVYHIYFHWGNK